LVNYNTASGSHSAGLTYKTHGSINDSSCAFYAWVLLDCCHVSMYSPLLLSHCQLPPNRSASKAHPHKANNLTLLIYVA
jgi:hypothetical protein